MLIPVPTPSSVATYLSYIEEQNAAPAASIHTFSGVSFGAGHSNRFIVVLLSYIDTGGSSPDPGGVTIGGYAATKLTSAASGGMFTGIYIANVPGSATSGSVFVALSGTLDNVGIGVFRMLHKTGTPNDTDSNSAGGSLSINTTDGGGLVASSLNTNGGVTSWTNAIEQYDEDIRSTDNHSGAMVASTTSTTLAVSSSSGGISCAASWS